MTTANKITIFRILLVPFFIVEFLYYVRTGDEWHRLFAVLAFAVAALLDGVDGYIARRCNQRSELGAVLDPLADKLLLISGVILLGLDLGDHFARIPLWLIVLILSRDAIVLTGVVVVRFMCGKVLVRARFAGKIATVFQMGTVLWILFQWTDSALPILISGAALFTGLSGVVYILDGIGQLNTGPASAARKNQSCGFMS